MVTRLHDEVYARLPHGRLVLIGGPGAGKTGAMILLLLAALDRRASLTGDQHDRVPVPVWLTLGGWDSVTTTLQDWAVSIMNRDHPALRAPEYGPDAVGELVRGGRVALFLDGLDEMPEGARAQALKRIGDEARGLRVVLTSRPEEYRRALQAGRAGNTAVIELRPVRPAAAAAYLLHGQSEPSRQRWEQVGVYLKQNPDSVAARALDNPLALSLARDTYTSQDPAVLTDPGRFATVEAVREHLIDQVLVIAYPDEHQRVHATLWLAWIAYHMGSSRDLPWWDIPSWVSPRNLRLTGGLILGLAVGLASGLVDVLRDRPLNGLVSGLGGGLVVGLSAWEVIRMALRHEVQIKQEKRSNRPHVLVPRWPPLRELGRLLKPVVWFGLAAGLTAGLAERFTVGLEASGLVAGLGVGLGVGLGFGLLFGLLSLWATPIADLQSATAASTYRADRRTSMIYGLVAGLGVGLGFGLSLGPRGGVGVGVGVGVLSALAGALLVGQVPLVKLTELTLTCQGWGQVHFLRLLEGASEQQVLRQAGTVYQFRHAVLQTHLAGMYHQIWGLRKSGAGDRRPESVSSAG